MDNIDFLQSMIGASMNDNTQVTFAGVGSAFAKKNAQTSMIIMKNGISVLVDCGTTIPGVLASKGIPIWAFDYYLPTHSHADHVGGYEELLLMSRYVAKKKPNVIITEQYFKILWDDTLRGGCEHNESELLKFSDLVEPVRPHWVAAQPREMYRILIPTPGAPLHLLLFRTAHTPGFVSRWEDAFFSLGVLIDGTYLYSGDTRFDRSLFDDLGDYMDPIVAKGEIFHDCQLFNPGVVHASYDELKTLPSEIKGAIKLVHYGDNFEDIHPEDDGFLGGFVKPWHVYGM